MKTKFDFSFVFALIIIYLFVHFIIFGTIRAESNYAIYTIIVVTISCGLSYRKGVKETKEANKQAYDELYQRYYDLSKKYEKLKSLIDS